MRKRNRKPCFVNGHCAYNCPNFQCDEFEERFDLPASEAGYERIKCKDCYLNSGECKDCLFQNCKECPEVDNNVNYT
jgi:hypothetical protein